ncbi:MAG: PTS sugar transporter subunit IIC [Deltaproteobacteria bacterium]|nr:PTS sugar transporter subunit IIC [Deltaproteobacteria bacterium]
MMELSLTTKVAALILLSGLIYLDRVAVVQMMIHRPIAVAVITGALFNRLPECTAVGVLLEMLWVSRLPVGASVPPDDTGAALFGTVAIAYLSFVREVGFADIALVGSVSVFIGEIGREMDILVRRLNGKISRYAIAGVELGDLGTVSSCLYASIVLWFVAGVILSFSWIVLGIVAGKFLIPGIPGTIIAPFQVMFLIIPATGAVSVYQHCRVSKKSAVFHMSLASGAIVFMIIEMGVF